MFYIIISNGSHMDLICDETYGCLLATNGDKSAMDSVWNVQFASGLTASGDDCIRNAVYNINMLSRLAILFVVYFIYRNTIYVVKYLQWWTCYHWW